MKIDTDKLEELFKERYDKIRIEAGRDIERRPKMAVQLAGVEDIFAAEFWLNYCDEHDIIMLHPEWLADTLNEGKMRTRVCIANPEEMFHENVCPWLLIPKKFAERCLILGGLP